MVGRFRSGAVRPAGAANDQLVRLGEQVVDDYRKAMDGFALHEGAAAAYRLIDGTNEFIAATAPWTLAKDPSKADRLTQVLFDAAEAIRLAAVLLEPIMPTSCREILRRVGANVEDPRGPSGLSLDRDGRWRADGERALLQEGPLWPRLEDKKESRPVSEEQRTTPIVPPAVGGAPALVPTNPEATAAAAAPGTQAPSTPAPGTAPGTSAPSTAPGTSAPGTAAPGAAPDRISIDDFMKVELRVARVLAAERVPKSNKLLKLQVDAGIEHRTLVAGIADSYDPDALVGKTVVIVFNLKPAKLMGIESNGMVLAASPDAGGPPKVVTFEEPPPPGSRVR
jgi:methionyl-tRNA synthetase